MSFWTGILKMFYSFVIISNFCLVPVPLQWIYVVIETKEINLSNPVRAHCYCASLVRTLFIGHARATSFLSARTESKT